MQCRRRWCYWHLRQKRQRWIVLLPRRRLRYHRHRWHVLGTFALEISPDGSGGFTGRADAQLTHAPSRSSGRRRSRANECLRPRICPPSSEPRASSFPSTGDTWSVLWPWRRRTLPSLDASVRYTTTGARPVAVCGANTRQLSSTILHQLPHPPLQQRGKDARVSEFANFSPMSQPERYGFRCI
jgi:hypothetical protein